MATMNYMFTNRFHFAHQLNIHRIKEYAASAASIKILFSTTYTHTHAHTRTTTGIPSYAHTKRIRNLQPGLKSKKGKSPSLKKDVGWRMHTSCATATGHRRPGRSIHFCRILPTIVYPPLLREPQCIQWTKIRIPQRLRNSACDPRRWRKSGIVIVAVFLGKKEWYSSRKNPGGIQCYEWKRPDNKVRVCNYPHG